MPKYDPIPVTPAIITWARNNAGFSIEQAKETFKAIEQWESGEVMPSYPQLESMSDKFKVPIAVFFFPEPPDLPSISESFRTIPENEFDTLPPKIRLLVRKAKAFQINLAELTGGQNPSERILTKDLTFTVDTAIETMAAEVRKYLGISIADQLSWPDADKALEVWRDAIQDAGIYVFKDPFRDKDFSGFCLYDDQFPLIYVNNTTPKTRQCFTLFHELCHLIFHTSGLDGFTEEFIDHLPDEDRRIEVICNRFAAEFLLPDSEFENAISGLEANRETAALLANNYNVSREFIYRKLLDRSLITQTEYREAAAAWKGEASRTGSGGDYYYNVIAYRGRPYIGLVLSQFYQNRIDDVEAADYLDVTPRNLGTLEDYFARGAV